MTRGTDVTNMKRTYRTAVATEFPMELTLHLNNLGIDLRYGENPNQPGALYGLDEIPIEKYVEIVLVKSGKGGIGAINFMDVTRAMDILKFFSKPSVAVMKHLIPSGFATQYAGNSLDQIYLLARDADARSAFGSAVVMNKSVDKATAEAINSSYVEVVAAPDFEEGVLDIFEQKKDLRVVRFSGLDRMPKFSNDDVDHLYDVRSLPAGKFLIQKPYLSSVTAEFNLIKDPMVIHEGTSYVVQRDPTKREMEDLLTAWYINLGVRSNGIVIVSHGVTLAVGSGQQERVGALEQAIVKAYQKAMDRAGVKYNPIDGGAARYSLPGNPLQGSVMSSDAFFPFRDSIDLAAQHGISAIIQPGGSIRDHEVIQAVNEHKMAMVYTLERCFAHF